MESKYKIIKCSHCESEDVFPAKHVNTYYDDEVFCCCRSCGICTPVERKPIHVDRPCIERKSKIFTIMRLLMELGEGSRDD